MPGTKMRLQRYGNEVSYRHEQEIIVDQAFLDTNNGLYIILSHPYVMGGNALDVFFNGQRLSEGGGYEEIDSATLKLDLGSYPPGHALAGQKVPLTIGDEIYITTWKAEYLQTGGNIDTYRFLSLEEEVIHARRYKDTDVPFHTLDDRLDYIQDRIEMKTIVMVLPKVMVGASKFDIRFPHEGVITEVYASCAEPGTTRTIIQIEKCTQNDYDSIPLWSGIFGQKMIVDANEKSSNTSSAPYSLALTQVEKNDLFRVNIMEAGNGAAGITIEVMVRV
ncbi:hypothetical protein GRF59_05540 [Paenibacillus sp. HJL G12]|uniref:Uncharacterized protein n=1 Tax=Paenibacillus dendrobii TaxID=2691084 RepID=A0A7X3LFK2_9BACL|nr:hypothetical protein [Paenibacillus dendrobii]MWV43087.1 hypothetical protein [Paenibacillus dendrobii]